MPSGNQQGESLEAQDHLERAAVERDHALEHAFRCLVEASLLASGLWRRMREHIIGVRVSETTAEMMMVTARVTANSRNRRPTTSPMKSNGISTAISETVSETMVKPICSAPLQRRLHGRVALFEVAGDVLDHDDGIVHHEAGGDGERHQREVVEAVAERIHGGEGADNRERHGHAGNDGGVQIAQEEEDHHHHQGDGQHQFKFNVGDRGLDVGGQVGEGGDLDAGRAGWPELRHQQLDALDHADGVGAGLALHVENHRRRLVHPGRLLGVLHAVHDVGDVVQKDRRIVAIGNDHIFIVAAGDQLIVGVDLVILTGTVEVAFGLVDAGEDQGGAHVFQIDPVGLQLRRIHLDAHRRLLAAADADQAHPVELGDLRRQAGVDQILHL